MNVTSLDPARCTGCRLCSNICPVNAVAFVENEEGFLHPQVQNNCIDCGLCATKCPALSGKHTFEDGNLAFGVQCKDDVRDHCSSGGVFKALADRVLQEGGAVCGAAFDPDFKGVSHQVIYDAKDLPKLLTSKYVQSDVNKVYREIKRQLNDKKPLLFCGCPCQVDALKTMLGKPYPNLITVDLMCHGATSPKAYRSFLKGINPEGKTITHVNFRSKDKGWGTLIKVDFADKTTVYSAHNDAYMRVFYSGINMRSACYQCPYATQERVGDITLGDYWGVKREWNDGRGISLVFAHTLKGAEWLGKIKPVCTRFEQVPYAEAVDTCKKTNGALIRPTYPNEMRKCFFYHLDKDGLFKAVRYAEKSLMDVGILGWWIHTSSSNYGSTLTAYALERYVASLGLSTAFISPPNFDRNTAGSFNHKYHYRMTAKYPPEEMWRNNQFFDTYIVGSDVLWYYDAMIASAGYNFMLNFASDHNRKIAYSTSFGNPKYFFPNEAIPYAKSLLHRFDAISSRELEGVRILKEKFDVNATQVVDPVFLCDRSVWDRLSWNAERKPQGDYVFAYYLDPTPAKIQAFDDLAKALGCKQISTTDRQYKPKEKAAMLQNSGYMDNVSLEEIVYLLMHAKYVMTDSFHGTCFSLLFRRDFYAFPNTQRDTSRFDTLSAIFGVDDRMIYDPQGIEYTSVDYQKVGEKIESETERCRNWLKQALFAPRK